MLYSNPYPEVLVSKIKENEKPTQVAGPLKPLVKIPQPTGLKFETLPALGD